MLFLVFVILFSGFDRDFEEKFSKEIVVVSVEDERTGDISMRKKGHAQMNTQK